MRLRRAVVLAITASLMLASTALARRSGPTPAFYQQRQARLKQTAQLLQQAGLPGYGVKYSRSGKSVRPAERQGAMLVTAVDGNKIQSWNERIGKQSIGFQTSAGCNSRGPSSGYVRIGQEWMSYGWVRANPWDRTTTPITSKSSQLTEATYMVTPAEMKAFRAFYYARNMQLIKDKNGRAIAPQWVYPGKSDLKTEGCAGAASSALNKGWVSQFGRNLSAIREYGRQNGIPALAEAPSDAAKLIRSFIDRVGAKQQTDPRVLVRHHAPSADLVTVFNQSFGANPQQTLKWDRNVHWYVSPTSGRRYRDRNQPNWTGLGYNHTIFDRAPGERAKPTWDAQRMSLTEFARSL